MRFAPIYYYRMWGGQSIFNSLGRKNSVIQQPYIGESWDIVDREDAQSILLNGTLKGLTLSELRMNYNNEIFGNSINIQSPFPLLIKILDAKLDLSLHVHPPKDYLQELHSGDQPKTEMWYILKSLDNSKIYAGVNADSKEFWDNIHSEKLKDLVTTYNAKPGNAFFIPSGTVHAIGAGNLILEIQQNSDITYRVSDWGRIDSSGKARDLHIEQSKKCIDFSITDVAKVDSLAATDKQDLVPKNSFFTVQKYTYKACNTIHETQEFEVITVVDGTLSISDSEVNFTEILKKGDSVILPCDGKYKMLSLNSCSYIITKLI